MLKSSCQILPKMSSYECIYSLYKQLTLIQVLSVHSCLLLCNIFILMNVAKVAETMKNQIKVVNNNYLT